jgi:hypothetical protein
MLETAQYRKRTLEAIRLQRDNDIAMAHKALFGEVSPKVRRYAVSEFVIRAYKRRKVFFELQLHEDCFKEQRFYNYLRGQLHRWVNAEARNV